jgi:ATP-binding cassette subfamily A (ABC1) protein 3
MLYWKVLYNYKNFVLIELKISFFLSPQQLKNKFGKGYTVLIKVATGIYENRLSRSNSQTGGRSHPKLVWRQNSIVPNDMVLTQNINEVKLFMEKSFPGSELKAIHNNLLHYYISDTSLSWAIIFGLIERAKERLNIEDYSIGQTTLEQIFLSFARKQREDID